MSSSDIIYQNLLHCGIKGVPFLSFESGLGALDSQTRQDVFSLMQTVSDSDATSLSSIATFLVLVPRGKHVCKHCA